MVATPCALALSSTALPVPESRLVIISTLAPLVIIWSAIVWNWVLSPWAFWMSDSTPAALKAASRSGLSAVSQRAEDLVSGRMTPILGVLPPPPAAAPLSPLSSSPPPQAARMRVSAATAAITLRNRLRMTRPFRRGSHHWRVGRCPPPGGNSIRARCVVVSRCLFRCQVAALAVALPDLRDGVGLERRGPGQLPAGRLRPAGQGPGGLDGGAVGHVLGGRRDHHRVAEHGRGDPAQRLRAGPATDQQHPADLDPLGEEGVEAVGEAAQQPLDGRPGQARRGGVGQPEAVQGAGGLRAVGGALALQVGDQGEPA